MSLLRLCLLACAALAPAAAQAAAGQVLFALGRVEIQRAGQSLPAARGTPVEVGDTISTGPTGLAQVRLQDGALLSLRYGSTLVVEEFRLPTPAAAPVAATPAAPATAPSAAVAGGRSALRLLRGAFRTVTGLIGRSANDAYSVVTPVATIGIRGTDYSAAYCDGDCGSTPDGLYVGVSNGGVEVNNDAGQLVLTNDQYGYVKDGATPPDRQLAPPEVLDAPIPPDEEGEEEGDRESTETAAGEEPAPDSSVRDEPADPSLAGGDTQPEGDYELRPGSAGSYAYASGAVTGSNNNGVYLDDRNALGGFLDGVFVSIGTATNTNLGADADTGLRWGRWTSGTASAGGSDLDLTNSSLHWIYATSSASPALAITGTRDYTLIGNTDPTDNNGGAGFLADATLFADFTNQTIDSTLSVGFGDVAAGGTLWEASGQGSIASGLFEGAYSSVTVNGSATGTSGDFAGFFTSGAAAAGLTFELTDGITTVNGAAAFEVTPQAPGGP